MCVEAPWGIVGGVPQRARQREDDLQAKAQPSDECLQAKPQVSGRPWEHRNKLRNVPSSLGPLLFGKVDGLYGPLPPIRVARTGTGLPLILIHA